MLTAAIALPVLSGVARAADFGCSNGDAPGRVRRRRYCLHPTGDERSAGVFTGIAIFDGNGKFTQRDYAGDAVPAKATDFVEGRNQHEARKTMGDWYWGARKRGTPGSRTRVCRGKRNDMHS